MDELISRAEAVKAALKVYHCAAANRDECLEAEEPFGFLAWLSAAESAKEVVQQLMELPGAEAEPVRHGRWEFIKRHGSTRPYHCSCGYASPGRFPYCPCCGAWMDGGETSAAE